MRNIIALNISGHREADEARPSLLAIVYPPDSPDDSLNDAAVWTDECNSFTNIETKCAWFRDAGMDHQTNSNNVEGEFN